MSVKIMSKIWEESEQKGSALLLLLAIADHADNDGFCWPGTEHLSKKIRMSVRSVYRKTRELEEAGELAVLRGTHNWYVVRLGMTDEQVKVIFAKRGFEWEPNQGDKLSRDTAMSRDNPDSRSDRGVTCHVTELCHSNHHEPSVNHQERDHPSATDDSPGSNLGGEKDGHHERVMESREPSPKTITQEEDDDLEDLFDAPKPKATRDGSVKARLTRMREKLGSDPLTVSAHTAKARQEVEHPDYGDPTHDSDPWLDVYRQFAVVFWPGIDIDRKPEKEKRAHIRELKRLAEEIGLDPEDAKRYIRATSRIETWLVGPSTTPFHKHFAQAFQNLGITDPREVYKQIVAKERREAEKQGKEYYDPELVRQHMTITPAVQRMIDEYESQKGA